MKTLRFSLASFLVALTAFVFFACQKDAKEPSVTSAAKPVSGGNCAGYLVDLAVDQTTTPGHTIFTWTITNPNPGNGSGTTLQNLSHWDFVPSTCLDQNWQDVYAASYRYGTTGDFTSIPLTGNDIMPDASLKTTGCYGNDVFKFAQGTTGTIPTQYRLDLIGNWGTGDLEVYYKSGAITGCCYNKLSGKGIGCPVKEECSFSQGYWFANNAMNIEAVHPWASTVTLGGKTYTNAEGLAIWNASNKGGITDAKRAFTQLAAIYLSGVTVANESVELQAAVATIECWLGGINKLSGTGTVYLPMQDGTSKTTCGNASAAAGVISTWIANHHCSN